MPPSPNYFDVLSEVEEEPHLDTVGSVLTQGIEPNHLVDLDLAVAIAPNLDANGKSPQSEWQKEQEAMDGELRCALDLSREEATALARRTTEAPGLSRDVVPRSAAGVNTTHAHGWTTKGISARSQA
jgi:hypothetical protein